MKKILLNLFVVTGLIFATSCSSNDDSDNGGSEEELVVTIDGQAVTFNSLVVNPSTDEYTTVTATINSQADRVVTLYINEGLVGSDALDFMTYYDNGVTYVAYSTDNSFSSVVSVNDGSKIQASFSITLTAYDSTNETSVDTVFSNGSVSVEY